MSNMSRGRKWAEPEKAKTKPKKIEGRGEPGGPYTPGAKAKRARTKSAGEKGMGSGKGE